MKVLVISQYFPPDIGGASTRAYNAAIGLSKKGCEVKVITAFPHYPGGKINPDYRKKALKIEEMNGLRIMRVWIPSLPHNTIINRIILHSFFIISSLFAIPFIGKVDVIWAANPNLFSLFPALIYGFVKRKRIIRNVDDLWPEVFYDLGLIKSKTLRRLLDFLAWLSYKVPVAVTPISPAYKRRIVEKYKINNKKIHVIEVGVCDIVRMRKTQKNKGCFKVMYSGILGVGYDFESVLKAAEMLREHKKIVFVIRGMGEFEHKIQRMAKTLKINNVVIDTNYLPKSELISLLNTADAFLLPMKKVKAVEEGLPTKIFEYQALGKPIICCSQGESATYVNFTNSGIVIEPGDPEALSRAILRLYRDKNLAQELGTNGWRYVSQNLTCEKIGERLSNLFKEWI